MAESDILNPTRGWWDAIRDNPNPSYGFPRRNANNNALARTRLGAPYSRDVANQAHGFEFYFIERPWATIQRLKQFYERYKGGYFTYIDYDGGGRHHVGRFTSPVNAMQVANDKYTVQGLVFEEIPTARMLQYPSDFVNWSKQINVLDDFLNPACGVNSVNPGAWVAQIDPSIAPAPSATDPGGYELFNGTPTFESSSPNNYDWAQVQYVGWGFQMAFRTAAGLGKIKVLVDDAYAADYVPGYIDLSTGARVAPPSGYLAPLPTGVTYVEGVLSVTQLPLDMHRVKIYAVAASGGNGVYFPRMKVIV